MGIRVWKSLNAELQHAAGLLGMQLWMVVEGSLYYGCVEILYKEAFPKGPPWRPIARTLML